MCERARYIFGEKQQQQRQRQRQRGWQSFIRCGCIFIPLYRCWSVSHPFILLVWLPLMSGGEMCHRMSYIFWQVWPVYDNQKIITKRFQIWIFGVINLNSHHCVYVPKKNLQLTSLRKKFIIPATDQPNLSTKVVDLQKSLPCRKEISEKSLLGWHRCWHCVDGYLKMLKCSENKNKVWPARSYMNHSIHISPVFPTR